jgi:hypothetical protein
MKKKEKNLLGIGNRINNEEGDDPWQPGGKKAQEVQKRR